MVNLFGENSSGHLENQAWGQRPRWRLLQVHVWKQADCTQQKVLSYLFARDTAEKSMGRDCLQRLMTKSAASPRSGGQLHTKCPAFYLKGHEDTLWLTLIQYGKKKIYLCQTSRPRCSPRREARSACEVEDTSIRLQGDKVGGNVEVIKLLEPLGLIIT